MSRFSFRSCRNAHLNGVSTRKIEKIAKRLGIETLSASEVSEINNGLEKVWLCVSDAHKGLQAAIRNTLPGTTWQRCKGHFMRNILAYVPQKEKEKVAAKSKLIWKAPDEKSARAMKDDFCEEYEKSIPKAVVIIKSCGLAKIA